MLRADAMRILHSRSFPQAGAGAESLLSRRALIRLFQCGRQASHRQTSKRASVRKLAEKSSTPVRIDNLSRRRSLELVFAEHSAKGRRIRGV